VRGIEYILDDGAVKRRVMLRRRMLRPTSLGGLRQHLSAQTRRIRRRRRFRRHRRRPSVGIVADERGIFFVRHHRAHRSIRARRRRRHRRASSRRRRASTRREQTRGGATRRRHRERARERRLRGGRDAGKNRSIDRARRRASRRSSRRARGCRDVVGDIRNHPFQPSDVAVEGPTRGVTLNPRLSYVYVVRIYMLNIRIWCPVKIWIAAPRVRVDAHTRTGRVRYRVRGYSSRGVKKHSTHARIVSSPHSDADDDDDDDVARVRRVGDASRRWEDRSRARAGRAFARAPDASRELDVDDDGIDDDEWISTTRAGFDDDARVSSRR